MAPKRAAPKSSSAKPPSRAAPAVDADGDTAMDSLPATNGNARPAANKRLEGLKESGGARKKARVSGASSVGSHRGAGREINECPEPFEHPDPRTQVFVFGNGDMGQFGLGGDVMDEIKRPRLHAWFEANKSTGLLGEGQEVGPEIVVAAGMHSLCIDQTGAIWSWGVNDGAALGRPTSKIPLPGSTTGEFIPESELEANPAKVESLQKDGFRAVRVVGGDSCSVALDGEGAIKVWGSFRNDQGLLGFGGVKDAKQIEPIGLKDFHDLRHVKFTSVSCGADFVLALTSTGHVYSFGSNDQHQLARRLLTRGDAGLRQLEAKSIGLSGIKGVGTGNYHGFAWDAEGRVWGWGANSHGQVGVGDKNAVVEYAREIKGLHPSLHDGAKVVQISGGNHHTLFLFDNGQVWGAGSSMLYELGLADDNPAKEDRVYEPVQIIFPAPPTSPTADIPELAPYATDSTTHAFITDISVGTHNNLAVERGGGVYSWGSGNQSQLGQGNEEECETPTIIRNTAIRDVKITKASAGGQHCVILGQKRA